MNRTERLLDLITYLLNAKEPVSWRKIKNHFPEDYARGVEESNQRKFERDKAELISLGIPIDYQSGSEGQKEGYLIQKDQLFLPEIRFTPSESSLLMLAAEAVRQNPNFPYRDQLESALHKILSIQSQMQPPPEDLGITYANEQREGSHATYLQQVQDALERRKAVKIRYHAFSTGEVRDREVYPYGLIYRKGKWTLTGWDLLRKDLRNFVLNRIQKLELNRKRPGTPDYEIPETFSLRRYQNQEPWELEIHETMEVRIQVSSHRLPELAPQLTRARKLGEGEFELEVTNCSGLISWILAQKTDVKIIEPVELREQLKDSIRCLL